MRWLRRLSQLLVFGLFIFLFLNTEYQDTDILPYAVNIFLRLDPLMAAATMLASQTLIALMWPALLTVVLTIVFGRFFCGWVCPLGAILDFTGMLLGGRRHPRPPAPRWRAAKYLILAGLTGSALFTLQLVFLLDPLSLLIRSLAVAVFPAINLALNTLFDTLYATGSDAVTAVSEPVYAFLKGHFLAFSQPYFQTAALTGAIFFAILALEYVSRRFWCRYLCPLGALFGLLGRFSLVGRRVLESDCTGCATCRTNCRMAAVAENCLGTDRGECIDCLDCQAICPEGAIRFNSTRGACAGDFNPSRRGVLQAFGAGALAAPLFGIETSARAASPARIRPPGALPEEEFLARCTRCGECMRVCIANGLQPAVFEAGLEGIWSPVLISRIGYCEYNCTLCGQVCPTGAITRLELARKQQVKIGLAEVDRSRCLPWNGASECIVCEEHCPTPEKAIRLRVEEVYSVNTGTVLPLKRPYVDEKLCIGCGICETKCPLSDRSAIIVTCRGETRAGGAGHS